ncbi:hypothetical protein COO91_08967 [Nostoc flagelliforme CCNUN1]|uniref:Uncharacterized protein n=1 Tax=Nostoc flagelliforme CCNUN1 TaxID=2038116 RepID=A0A2K8T588_9NOSO|nr:hypothetical protein COO91_08967 [Nostoc flagelliforme CCNUN1]
MKEMRENWGEGRQEVRTCNKSFSLSPSPLPNAQCPMPKNFVSFNYQVRLIVKYFV